MATTDPLVHALLAATVAAPLAPRFGRGPVVTAVVAGTLIDVDHPLAARSLRLAPMISMEMRPRSHSLLTAAAAAIAGAAAGGPVHGWAAFAGLTTHLLYDAGDLGAPTPLLWPWRRARQLGRARTIAGMALLACGSVVVSRATGSSVPSASASAGGGGA